jgi:hypothetical protein
MMNLSLIFNSVAVVESTARAGVFHRFCLKRHFLAFRPTDYQGFQPNAGLWGMDKALK